MLLVPPSRFLCLFPMMLYLVYWHFFERSQIVMFEEVGCPEHPSTSTTESPFFHQHVSAALVDRRIASRIRTARFVRHRNVAVDWLILVVVVFEVKHLCRFFKAKQLGEISIWRDFLHWNTGQLIRGWNWIPEQNTSNKKLYSDFDDFLLREGIVMNCHQKHAYHASIL